jgi:hypothetical protein
MKKLALASLFATSLMLGGSTAQAYDTPAGETIYSCTVTGWVTYQGYTWLETIKLKVDESWIEAFRYDPSIVSYSCSQVSLTVS